MPPNNWPSGGSTIFKTISPLTVALLLLVACSPTASDTPKSSTAETTATEATPDKDHQACFACDGKGIMACKAGCAAGQVECPGPCLKLTRGSWQHMEVTGHPASDLWQKFPDGPGQWTAWN